ncbi:MAG: 3-phosphoshikimate 1-carboxyvinyltransferase [Hyphococcus sp.]|nr:MAG: 3-phosphoshikimate 1-carboxyvinyltransferase [Marinicaulis sp.]
MTALLGKLTANETGPLRGVTTAPGDKSISHRGLIFGALAEGVSEISGLLEGEDVLRTAAAMRAVGADIERQGGRWIVRGGRWVTPERAIYFGNSGTGARLVIGAAAGAGIGATFDGDQSLRSRPMGRVLEPLRLMGVEASANDGSLPVEIQAGRELLAINCKLSTPSAQVKSAILLAGLGAKGTTRVHEPVLCRDHTERMLSAFGVQLEIAADGEDGRFISLEGGQRLKPSNVMVPGDPSSAAFIAVAAVITPGSDITIKNVLINPLRAGVYETLREMGADITFDNKREECGEPIADIHVRHSVLRGVDVPAVRAPSMIDEYPILAIAASMAIGETKMLGIEELRVKESDRIAAVEAGLVACGVDVESGEDWLRVRGQGKAPPGSAVIKTQHDHRIAMSFLILGGVAQKPVEIDDASMIATSYPGFVETMSALGGKITGD